MKTNNAVHQDHAPRSMFQFALDLGLIDETSPRPVKRTKQRAPKKENDLSLQLELLLSFPDEENDHAQNKRASDAEINEAKQFSEFEQLLVAEMVLCDAILIAVNAMKDSDAFKEAYDWIMETKPVAFIAKKPEEQCQAGEINAVMSVISLRDVPFSFQWCCRVLRYDADDLRCLVTEAISADLPVKPKRKRGPNVVN